MLQRALGITASHVRPRWKGATRDRAPSAANTDLEQIDLSSDHGIHLASSERGDQVLSN